jgi:Domain of Unknown Function (DUF349)
MSTAMKNENEGLEKEVEVHESETIIESPYLGDGNDLTDHEVLDLNEDHKPADYSAFAKRDFVELVKELSQESDFRKSDRVIREIKPLYDEIREKERHHALQQYIAQSGSAEGFEFKGDDSDHTFNANLRLIRDRKNQFYKSIEEQKTSNLQRKLDTLEKLRALVDSDDSENGFHEFKQLQQDWKGIGPVPATQSKTLWANYTALVDRFYDHRSIYFELKELDRKKNLELKLELCAKAEHLLSMERIKDAIRILNELHHEFRHLGPVPKEDKEFIWQRFKAASDAIYKKRDEFVTNLQAVLHQNMEAKSALVEKLLAYATFQSDRIKEWNEKTHEILEYQKQWEGIGAIPRAKAKDVNKKFWSSFKAFFNNKNSFFRKLDDERDKNLKAKNEIVKKAEELKNSLDWEKTANDLKELQRQWKEVGPVPEKLRERIYQEFKVACDHFFEQRRTQFDKADRDQESNLKEKENIILELEHLAEEKSGSLDQLNALQKRFVAIGFVPKKSIIPIKNRFNSAVEKLLASLEISADEKDRALLEIQLGELKNDPQADYKLYNKEQTLRKRISRVENDIALWRNNLEFFGRSKNAEKVKEEFNGKIQEASDHLAQLKNQLKLLKTVSQ